MKSKALEEFVELPENKCGNCGLETNGFFCPRCGQKHLKGRFSLKQSFEDVFNQIFNLERGLIYTFYQLLINPRKVITAYLNKATVRYMHPFRFAFILATISALLTIVTGTFELPELAGMLKTSDPEKVENMQQAKEFMEVFKKYLTFILLASIPINSLVTKLIYFRKKLNYAEHLILNAYTYGLVLALTLPLYLLMFTPEGIYMNGLFSALVYYGVFSWVFSEYFKENYMVSFLKMILLTVIILVGLTIFMIIVGITYAKFFET